MKKEKVGWPSLMLLAGLVSIALSTWQPILLLGAMFVLYYVGKLGAAYMLRQKRHAEYVHDAP